jgi:hypothetical protein
MLDELKVVGAINEIDLRSASIIRKPQAYISA